MDIPICQAIKYKVGIMMFILKWLQNFCIQNYDKICHENEIVNIYTVDNPGWRVKIDLRNTNLISKSFNEVSIDNSDDDWVFIKIMDNVFDAACDKNKLVYALSFFKEWSQDKTFNSKTFSVNYDKEDLLYWLQNNWFCLLDFGWDGMEYHGVKISTKSDRIWNVEIELMDTYLENKEFNSFSISNSKSDWVNIKVENDKFKGSGDENKLEFIIERFKEWAEMYSE